MGFQAARIFGFRDDFHEAVDFLGGVVEVKTGAGGGFNSQLVHERLVAVVAAAQSDAALVRDGDDVVRMNVLEEKAHEAGPI